MYFVVEQLSHFIYVGCDQGSGLVVIQVVDSLGSWVVDLLYSKVVDSLLS